MRISDWSSDVCSSDLQAGGFSLEDPGYIAHMGLQAIVPLMLRVRDMLGPIDFFLNFLEITLFLLAALTILVSFCVLAIQVFLAFLEYRLLSLAAYVAIPFAVLGDRKSTRLNSSH